MSGDRTSPRFQIVASTRRLYTDAQKRGIVAEIEAGASVSEVARRHNMHTSLLFRWRREYAAAQPCSAAAPKPAPHPPSAATFLPVALATVASSKSSAPAIEIETAGGRKLRVAADIDVGHLKRIIAALETLP
jgi:transposase